MAESSHFLGSFWPPFAFLSPTELGSQPLNPNTIQAVCRPWIRSQVSSFTMTVLLCPRNLCVLEEHQVGVGQEASE
jgi:hypothetical protein